MCGNGGREREVKELLDMKRKRRRECSIHSSFRWHNLRRRRSCGRERGGTTSVFEQGLKRKYRLVPKETHTYFTELSQHVDGLMCLGAGSVNSVLQYK